MVQVLREVHARRLKSRHCGSSSNMAPSYSSERRLAELQNALSWRDDGDVSETARDLLLLLKSADSVTLGRHAIISHHEGHFNLNIWALKCRLGYHVVEITRFKRCTGRLESFSGRRRRKQGRCDKVEQKEWAEEIAQICPASFHPCVSRSRSGILTPDTLCLDECLPVPRTLEIGEIGRRTESMKPADNDIWLGFSTRTR